MSEQPLRPVYYSDMAPSPIDRSPGSWAAQQAALRKAEAEQAEREHKAETLRKSQGHALPATNRRMLAGAPPSSAEQAESARDAVLAAVERAVKCRAKDCDHSAVAFGGGVANPDGSVQCPGPQTAVTRARPDRDEQAAEAAARPRQMRGGIDPEHGMVVALKRNNKEILGKLADWSEDLTGATVHTHAGTFQVAMSDLRAVPDDELQGHRDAQEQREQQARNEEYATAKAHEERMAKAIEPETGPGLSRDEKAANMKGGLLDRIRRELLAKSQRGYSTVVAMADEMENTEVKDGKIIRKSKPAARRSWLDAYNAGEPPR